MAFLDPDDRTIGLVEVKEEDQLGRGSGDQTDDYLSYIKKNSTHQNPIHFAYVTKHLPSESSSLALQNEGFTPKYYSELHNGLSKYLVNPQNRQRSPIAQLFCKYLQEEGVVYQKLASGDDNTLLLLLRQGFGIRGKKDVTAERQMQVPTLLGTLLSNVQAMGVEFHNRFKDHLGNKFLPRFAFYPSWQMKGVAKHLKDKDWYNDVDGIEANLCDGGEFYLWSEGRLRSQDSCYIWVGYEFELSLSKKKMTKHLYAGVGIGNRLFEDFSNFNSFPEYGQAQRGVQKIIRNQIKKAISSDGAPGGRRLAKLGKALEED